MILPCVLLQCSHIMAMSVQKLFPGTQVTIGPWIDRGFYYDFDTKQTISQEDLKGIKKEMQRIIKKKLPFVREEVSMFAQCFTPAKLCAAAEKLCRPVQYGLKSNWLT